ncbi:glutathione peroxidase [Acidicapsa acidisoli]|uniref:glutathione peroxidase n=1 Tax=Acidicapsa acidisoli TaxID=1615681 RepID=UPI00295C199F|nr:glutathione peroxidase [Acidicapsa acidisoli]
MTEAIQKSIYDFSARSIDGHEVALAQYAGQVLVIVNTASKCGFTPQYAALETLYRQYRDRGMSVLGFPCNQFGAQEPGNEAEITQFCESNYGVSFPIFAKIDVNGPNAHPLYKYLKSEQSGLFGVIGLEGIKWNFTKFLIDRAGKAVGRYAPATSPSELVPEIEKLLSA